MFLLNVLPRVSQEVTAELHVDGLSLVDTHMNDGKNVEYNPGSAADLIHHFWAVHTSRLNWF